RPDEPEARAKVALILRLAEAGVVGPLVRLFHDLGAGDPNAKAAALAGITAGLERLEVFAFDGGFAAGLLFSQAACVLAPALHADRQSALRAPRRDRRRRQARERGEARPGELIAVGSLAALDRQRARTPVGVVDMLERRRAEDWRQHHVEVLEQRRPLPANPR